MHMSQNQNEISISFSSRNSRQNCFLNRHPENCIYCVRVRPSLIKVAKSLDEVVGGVLGAATHYRLQDRQERLEGDAVVGAVLVHQLLHL